MIVDISHELLIRGAGTCLTSWRSLREKPVCKVAELSSSAVPEFGQLSSS